MKTATTPTRDMREAMLRPHHDQLAYVLAPMLAALGHLATSQRVLSTIADAAKLDPALEGRLRDICPDYRDAIDAAPDGFAVLSDLARVARQYAEALACRMDPDATPEVP